MVAKKKNQKKWFWSLAKNLVSVFVSLHFSVFSSLSYYLLNLLKTDVISVFFCVFISLIFPFSETWRPTLPAGGWGFRSNHTETDRSVGRASGRHTRRCSTHQENSPEDGCQRNQVLGTLQEERIRDLVKHLYFVCSLKSYKCNILISLIFWRTQSSRSVFSLLLKGLKRGKFIIFLKSHTTLFQRLYNVIITLGRRRMNVIMTLCTYWVIEL